MSNAVVPPTSDAGIVSSLFKGRSATEIVILLLLLGGSGFSLGSLSNRITPEEADRRSDLAVQAALSEERRNQDYERLEDRIEALETQGAKHAVAIDSVQVDIKNLKRQIASGFGSIERQIDRLNNGNP